MTTRITIHKLRSGEATAATPTVCTRVKNRRDLCGAPVTHSVRDFRTLQGGAKQRAFFYYCEADARAKVREGRAQERALGAG